MNSISHKAVGFLYILILIVLSVTTIVEDYKGTHFVTEYVYGSYWFVLLLFLLFSTELYVAVHQKCWKNLSSLLMHLSLGLILIGAFLSYTTSEQGFIHLRKGEKVATFQDKKGNNIQMPFSVELDSFVIRHYPGTEAVMDYVSFLTTDHPTTGEKEASVVSMNHNLVKEGYRFCQSSFDDDHSGSWLSVNHDPYGVNTTFTGYILFAIAALVTLLRKNGAFQQMLRNPQLKKGTLFALLILLGGTLNETSAKQVPVLSKEEAYTLQRKQVVYQDRVVPFNTVAIDFVKKIYGAKNYNGLMPEQVVGGWSIAPEVWKEEKMIKVKSAEVRHALSIEGTYCRLSDLFDEKGTYRLSTLWAKEQRDPEISKLERGIIELDEKVAILHMLERNTLYQALPADSSGTSSGDAQLSEAKVSAEILYNRLSLTKILFMINLTLGTISFILLVYNTIRQKPKRFPKRFNLLSFLLLIVLLVHAFGYGLRWYISGRIPLNNGFETMQFLALIVMVIDLLLCHRYRFVLPFGFLLSGFALLVSHLGEMNPQITPLMPVLNSPWLSIHVSMIMTSYALFAFLFLNSLFAWILMGRSADDYGQQIDLLTLFNRLLLYPAVLLLGIGITLGAVWANESWGNYWAWDPKEVWALITLMTYGAAIVFAEVPLFQKPKTFHTYLLLAFLTVLMTYFGVNYLLGGMHSYANG